MMVEKFLDILARVFPSRGITQKEAEALSRLDPNDISAIDVQRILFVDYLRAVQICDTAVRQGYFEKVGYKYKLK